jgi:hypothetical protein
VDSLRALLDASAAVRSAWDALDSALSIYFAEFGEQHADGCPADDPEGSGAEEDCTCEHVQPLRRATPEMMRAMANLGDAARLAALLDAAPTRKPVASVERVAALEAALRPFAAVYHPSQDRLRRDAVVSLGAPMGDGKEAVIPIGAFRAAHDLLSAGCEDHNAR